MPRKAPPITRPLSNFEWSGVVFLVSAMCIVAATLVAAMMGGEASEKAEIWRKHCADEGPTLRCIALAEHLHIRIPE